MFLPKRPCIRVTPLRTTWMPLRTALESSPWISLAMEISEARPTDPSLGWQRSQSPQFAASDSPKYCRITRWRQPAVLANLMTASSLSNSARFRALRSSKSISSCSKVRSRCPNELLALEMAECNQMNEADSTHAKFE